MDRLQEVAPDPTSDEIPAAIEQAHAIEARAYDLTASAWGAERARGGGIEERALSGRWRPLDYLDVVVGLVEMAV